MDEGPTRIDRRQALRRFAAAGAAAWAVPAIQTINMSRAFAQAQMSQPSVCSWFRITQGDATNGGASGVCGQPISSSDSCLSTIGAVDCSPVVGTPSTQTGSAWSLCLATGYLVQEVALVDAAGSCWRSQVDATDPTIGQAVHSPGGMGGWVGWYAAGGCLSTPRPTDAVGAPLDIASIDVIACGDPAAVVAPAATASPTTSPSTNGPTGSTSAETLPSPESAPSPTATSPPTP